jgi:hypothetical protein
MGSLRIKLEVQRMVFAGVRAVRVRRMDLEAALMPDQWVHQRGGRRR